MSRPTLRDQVAEAVRGFDYVNAFGEYEREACREVADAVVGVVLGAVQAELEAIAWDARAASPPLRVLSFDQVLTVLARLGGTT